MPEGTPSPEPGADREPIDENVLFPKADGGYVAPEQKDSVQPSQQIGAAAADTDRRRADRAYHQQFLAERGLGPQPEDPREKPYEEIVGRGPDRESTDMAARSRTNRGIALVREAYRQAVDEAEQRPPRVAGPEAADPHAVPKHSAGSRMQADDQVVNSRWPHDAIGQMLARNKVAEGRDLIGEDPRVVQARRDKQDREAEMPDPEPPPNT